MFFLDCFFFFFLFFPLCSKTLVSIWSSWIEQNPRIGSGATSTITCYNETFVCFGWIIRELDL